MPAIYVSEMNLIMEFENCLSIKWRIQRNLIINRFSPRRISSDPPQKSNSHQIHHKLSSAISTFRVTTHKLNNRRNDVVAENSTWPKCLHQIQIATDKKERQFIIIRLTLKVNILELPSASHYVMLFTVNRANKFPYRRNSDIVNWHFRQERRERHETTTQEMQARFSSRRRHWAVAGKHCRRASVCAYDATLRCVYAASLLQKMKIWTSEAKLSEGATNEARRLIYSLSSDSHRFPLTWKGAEQQKAKRRKKLLCEHN